METAKKDWVFADSGEIVEAATHAEALARFVDLYAWSDLTPRAEAVVLWEEGWEENVKLAVAAAELTLELEAANAAAERRIYGD